MMAKLLFSKITPFVLSGGEAIISPRGDNGASTPPVGVLAVSERSEREGCVAVRRLPPSRKRSAAREGKS
jgi:hypothetical protein